MYAGLPAMSKWLTVKNEHGGAAGEDVTITSLTMEVLHVTQEAMLHGWASDFQDAIRSNTPNSVTGRVHMESEMCRAVGPPRRWCRMSAAPHAWLRATCGCC
jgi:hypothetical protein